MCEKIGILWIRRGSMKWDAKYALVFILGQILKSMGYALKKFGRQLFSEWADIVSSCTYMV